MRLEFIVCTNSSHFCTFISSKIIPRYPNHSIPMLRIQYVDYISGTGVSDPDKGKHMGPEDPSNRKKYPSFFLKPICGKVQVDSKNVSPKSKVLQK